MISAAYVALKTHCSLYIPLQLHMLDDALLHVYVDVVMYINHKRIKLEH